MQYFKSSRIILCMLTVVLPTFIKAADTTSSIDNYLIDHFVPKVLQGTFSPATVPENEGPDIYTYTDTEKRTYFLAHNRMGKKKAPIFISYKSPLNNIEVAFDDALEMLPEESFACRVRKQNKYFAHFFLKPRMADFAAVEKILTAHREAKPKEAAVIEFKKKHSPKKSTVPELRKSMRTGKGTKRKAEAS